MTAGPLQCAWLDQGLRIVTDMAYPPGKVFAFPERPHEIHMHPLQLVGLEIQLGERETTYAQRTTMQGIARSAWARRRWLWSYRELRERVRHLDGVKP